MQRCQQERPYHSDSTASRLLSEVKHCRARLVLRWGTTLESLVLFFCNILKILINCIFLQTFCLYLTNLFCPLIICNKSDVINFFPCFKSSCFLSRSLLKSYQQKELQYVTCFNEAHKTHMNHHEHSCKVVATVKMDELYANVVVLKP